jgi:hypothetical protein
MAPCTQLELFSHSLNGLKNMKDHFSQLPCLLQSQHWSIKEPLWSVLEIKEEKNKILLESVQNLYAPIARINAVVLKVKLAQRHVNKETHSVSVVFHYIVPPLHFPCWLHRHRKHEDETKEHQTSETYDKRHNWHFRFLKKGVERMTLSTSMFNRKKKQSADVKQEARRSKLIRLAV